MRQIAGTMIFAFGLTGCDLLGIDDGRMVSLMVNHYKLECQGVALRLCLLVKGLHEVDYTYLYDTPDGFVYEWGYVYRIIVEEKVVANPPADGSSIRRTLRKVVSKERVAAGTRFEVILTAADGRVEAVSLHRYRFYSEAEFECVEMRCDDLAALIENGGRAKYLLAHPADDGQPLQVMGWEACDMSPGNQVCGMS